jgi:hypothetical protein
MGAIRELDENHTQVLNHREQHLAKALRLRFFGTVETQVIELADAIHEQCDVLAELRFDLAQGAAGILEDIVQERRFDRAGVESQAGQYFRDRDRVRDIRRAAAALLAVMKLGAVLVSRDDAAKVFGR